MWFSQYGRQWGPWFHTGDTVYLSGVMAVRDTPTTLLTTGDIDGQLAIADR